MTITWGRGRLKNGAFSPTYWDPMDPDDVAEMARRDAERERRERIEELRQLLGVDNVPAPIVWTGTMRQLADVIRALHQHKWIQVHSEDEAFRLMSCLFVRKSGEPINYRSLRQTLRNRTEEGK